MKASRLAIVFSFLMSYSCVHKGTAHKVDPAAISLNDKAVALIMTFSGNKDSSNKAIALLDSATSIDSNYFLGFYNKLMFLDELGFFDKAINTVNNLIRIRPNANDLYLTRGMLYAKTKDSAAGNIYFKKCLSICNSILDTMNEKNKNYYFLSMNRAISIILLGDSTKGQSFT